MLLLISGGFMTPFPEVVLKKFKRKHIAHYFFPVGYFFFSLHESFFLFFFLHFHKSCKPQPICFATSPLPGKGTGSQDPNSISQKLWGKQFVGNLEASTHLKPPDRALQKSLFRVWMEGDLPINAVNSVKLQSLAREKMPKWGGGRERQTP